MNYEARAYLNSVLAEVRVVTMILDCEMMLSGRYILYDRPHPKAAKTVGQINKICARRALLQDRLAIIRMTRPPAPTAFAEPDWTRIPDLPCAEGTDLFWY